MWRTPYWIRTNNRNISLYLQTQLDPRSRSRTRAFMFLCCSSVCPAAADEWGQQSWEEVRLCGRKKSASSTSSHSSEVRDLQSCWKHQKGGNSSGCSVVLINLSRKTQETQEVQPRPGSVVHCRSGLIWLQDKKPFPFGFCSQIQCSETIMAIS